MKRIVLAIFAFAVLCMPKAAAQEEVVFPKNEIGLSYGRASIPGIGATLGAAFGAAFSFGLAQPSQLKVLGAGSLSYYRWLGNGRFALGGESTLELIKLTFKYRNGKDEDGNVIYKEQPGGYDSYISLMPAVKVNWFRHPHFAMYSKLAGGAVLVVNPAVDSVDSDGNAVHDPASLNICPSYQFSPLGMEFGGGTVRGFAEMGIGMNGFVLAGARWCF